ncbi:MAG: rRNA maturation RNase YbeY [Minisyncoccia bacterium]
MILEFEAQVPNTPDYSSLIALCVDIFSQNIDRKFQNTTVSVAIVSENTIQHLNAQYRNNDKVTDVLSFNLMSDYSTEDMTLGEILICYNKALLQAQELGHSIEYEIATLCIHGLFHLIGYDHQTDDDYQEMQQKEKNLLSIVKQHYSFS